MVGEGATLAHFAGAAAVAAALPADRFEVVLASPERYRQWTPPGCAWRPLETLETSVAYARMNTGRPLYDLTTLQRYVADDLAHFAEVKPDLVIGDSRLSLGVSARKAGVPYVALAYAAWHPDRRWRPEFPCLRWTGAAPLPALRLLHAMVGPATLRWHGYPIRKLYRSQGLGVAPDLRSLWTEADLVLYADLPGLFPELADTPGRRFIGPVIWSPPVEPPKWWNRLPEDRPVAYVSVGSSGDRRILPTVVAGLRQLDFTVMISTAGRVQHQTDHRRVFTANYLPGPAACARADLVVSNGGALTTAQALTAGKPLLGICTNLDQFLEMHAVEAAGAGLYLRSDRVTPADVASSAERLLDSRFRKRAAALQAAAPTTDFQSRLSSAIEALAS